jgi:AraC-like DNA-binding protein
MSVSTFRRTFNSVIGIAPKEYILRCCIKKAEKLLITTNDNILRIGQASGFPDPSAFNRQFMKKNGISPLQFRKKYQ